MKGADEFYNVVQKAVRYELGSLRRVHKLGLGGDTYASAEMPNVVYVLGQHARGNTFRIVLVENTDTMTGILPVYDIVAGYCGWTEEYGWSQQGPWVQVILAYIDKLITLIDERDRQLLLDKQKRERAMKNLKYSQIEFFNKLFEHEGVK
jgi:hypothetical protein